MAPDNNVIESLRLFAQTAKIMNSTLNRGELVDIMLEEVAKLLDCSLMALVIRDDGSDTSDVYLAHDRKRRHIPVPDSVVFSEEHLSDQPENMEIAPDDFWRNILSDEFGVEVTSRLRFKLVNRGKLMGFLDVYDCKCEVSDLEYSVEMINAMTDLFVIAWDNAEMYDAMKRKSLQNDLLL